MEDIMKRRTYYRVVNGGLETATFNKRSKARAGGWYTNATVARRMASSVALAERRDMAWFMETFTRDGLRLRAAQMGISGRSSMSKEGLARALAEVGGAR
jgi:hypothetical protein